MSDTDTIRKTIDLAAPLERVWRALTDHDQFGAWFRVKLDGPFKPGEMATGRITYPGYEHVVWQARIEVIEPQHLFAFSWRPYAIDPERDYTQEPMTRVEFRLEPLPTGTRLTLTESGFDALPADRKAEAFRMNDGGWAQQMLNIKTYLDDAA